ncbi:MAG: cyclase family protein, partial [Ilumatobacteraceae bacterium]
MQDFREIGAALRNWGRWGDDDERGTVNLITPERVVAATRLVRRGAIFDLGIPFDATGPQPGGGRINPVRLMSETGSQQEFPGAFHYADDYVFMPLQSASQWDGLAHVFYDDHLYNGFPASDVGPHGAMHCSIDKLAKGIVGRGVLLDLARLKGVEWLAAGEVITPDDLDAAAERQG